MARNRKPGTGDYTNGHFDEYERAHRRDGVMWKVLTGLMILTLGVLVLMDLLLPPQKGGFETEPEAPKAIARDELGALERPSIPLRLLTTPRNLCIARGKLWVVGDKRLCRVNPDQGGSEPWSLNLDIEPMAVAVDEATGTCYIAATDHVRVYDSTGKRLAVWPAVDPKSQLLDIEVNNQGDVFVADYGMRAVYRYTLDGMMVNKIGVVGETYKTVPGIVLPSPYFDMVLSKVGGRYDGLVRLTNTGKLRVDTYTYDGYFEMSFGRSGQSERDFYGCCNPVRIAQLPDGNFVTAEKGVQRLKEYSPGGVFLRVLANRHTLGTDRSELALAAGADGTIYLLDENESKIRVFLRKRPAGAAASSRPVIQPKPLPRAESKPEPKIEPKPEPKEEPKPALKPEPKPAPKTPIFLEPEPKPKAVPTRLPDPARLTDPIFFDPAEASQEKSKPIVIPKPAPVPAPAPAFKPAPKPEVTDSDENRSGLDTRGLDAPPAKPTPMPAKPVPAPKLKPIPAPKPEETDPDKNRSGLDTRGLDAPLPKLPPAPPSATPVNKPLEIIVLDPADSKMNSEGTGENESGMGTGGQDAPPVRFEPQDPARPLPKVILPPKDDRTPAPSKPQFFEDTPE